MALLRVRLKMLVNPGRCFLLPPEFHFVQHLPFLSISSDAARASPRKLIATEPFPAPVLQASFSERHNPFAAAI